MVRWCDASSRELPDFPQRGARIGGQTVLARAIDGVARDVDETYVRFPITVPRDGVDDIPIAVCVVADGAEQPASVVYPLRIGRGPQAERYTHRRRPSETPGKGPP